MNRKRKIRPKSFILQTQILITILILVGACINSIILYNYIIQNQINKRKVEIQSIASQLNITLHSHVNDKLRAVNPYPNKQQVIELNKLIQPIVMQFSNENPNYGLGYYDRRLKSIIAIGPIFKESMLEDVPKSYGYFRCYTTGKPDFAINNTSIGWMGEPIIYVNVPYYLDGFIIGHTWANMKMKDIYINAFKAAIIQLLIWILVLGIILYTISQRLKIIRQGLSTFADGVTKETFDSHDSNILSELIPAINKIRNHLLEKNQLQHELRLSEERFYKLFMNSPDIMILFDPETRKYFEVNQAFLKCFGYTREEVIGRTSEELFYTPEMSDLLCNEVITGRSITNVPLTFRTKDHNELQLVVSVEKVSIGGKEYLISSSKDLTQQRRIEKELARLDRLDLVGQMAASISHEVRNPMTVVKGFLQLMDEKEIDSTKKTYYQIMIEEIDRANNIISEFLSLARDKAVDAELHNLNNIIDTVYPLILAQTLKEEKQLIFERGNILETKVDDKEIRQLILNLVRNSLEAMSSGGIVWIRTYMENKNIILSIQDQGPGIDKAILDKIGTPFITTKETGTGLGLAVCYNIADRNNAYIEVDTNSSGTTFKVKFETKED